MKWNHVQLASKCVLTTGNEGNVEELQKAKYEGILVDFDNAPDPILMLDALRRSPSNRNAVSFGVATKADDRRQAQEKA